MQSRGLVLLFLCAARALSPLKGVSVTRVRGGEGSLDLGTIAETGAPTLCVFGTYAADFNAIEYCQKVTHYWPQLKAKGIERAVVILNAKPSSCEMLACELSLPDEVELCSDPSGAAGRAFGVGTGWRPDDQEMSPYVKLLGMLVGLGAANTLPSVITGYFGNPWGEAGWIQSAMRQGAAAERWPGGLVVRPRAAGEAASYAFDELPVVSGWGRRPLELATLRLQNMVGLSLAKWGELKPDDEFIDGAGVLTQLGGCAVVQGERTVFEYRDNGICATADFEALLSSLGAPASAPAATSP